MKTDPNIRELIIYRLQQSEDCLRAAELMLEENLLRDSVNRSYYSMFYIVLALLCLKGEKASKHAHVIGLFDQIYVKEELFDKELSAWFHEAFDLRQRSDYREMVNITSQRAKEILAMAERFVEKARNYLKIELERT